MSTDLYTTARQLGALCAAGDLPGIMALDLDGIERYWVEVNNAVSDAIKNGHVDVARWMLDHCENLESKWRHDQPWRVLGSCAEGSGDPAMAEWLVERFQLTDANCNVGQLLISACEKGNMQFILWLAEKFTVTADHALYQDYWRPTPLFVAIHNGHFEVATWLVRTLSIRPEEDRVDIARLIRDAAYTGRLDTVKWLFGAFKLCPYYANLVLDNLPGMYDAGVVKWLRERFPSYGPKWIRVDY